MLDRALDSSQALSATQGFARACRAVQQFTQKLCKTSLLPSLTDRRQARSPSWQQEPQVTRTVCNAGGRSAIIRICDSWLCRCPRGTKTSTQSVSVYFVFTSTSIVGDFLLSILNCGFRSGEGSDRCQCAANTEPFVARADWPNPTISGCGTRKLMSSTLQ